MFPTILCGIALFFCCSCVHLCTETEESPKIRRIISEIEKDKGPVFVPIIVEF